MRARNFYPIHCPLYLGRAAARFLLAPLLALSLAAAGWAQETTSDEEVMPPAPTPPAPAEAPKVDKQVRITRDEQGNLQIKTRDESGESTEVSVDLGEEFGSDLSRRILSRLESKGIVDGGGLVTERALSDVPKNVRIGISGDLDFDGGDLSHQRGGSDMDWLVPVVAVLAVFGTPILIVWLVTRNSYRKKQLLMDNINRMVAEGRDIPPELLDAMEGESPRNMKDRGFTLIAVGLALFIWLTAAAGAEVGSLGLIPLFIGVARYINWKLDNRQAQG